MRAMFNYYRTLIQDKKKRKNDKTTFFQGHETQNFNRQADMRSRKNNVPKLIMLLKKSIKKISHHLYIKRKNKIEKK